MPSSVPESPPFSSLPPGIGAPRRAVLGVKRALKLHALPPVAAAYGAVVGRSAPPERRFHAYGVGAPKSGTHSVANLFSPAYRSAHEPHAVLTLMHLLRWLEGRSSDAAMERLLRARDRWLGLEVEAAHYLHHVVGMLVRLFPEARFVLTIRDPYTWLGSAVVQSIHNYGNPHPNRMVWLALSDLHYRPYGFTYAPEEEALRRHGGVYPIGSYLEYWTAHNRAVLDAVPPERLLVVRTHELRAKSAEMARFLGADPAKLTVEGAHAFARPVKEVVVHEVVDHRFLEAEVERRCAPLLERFFPEVRSLDDALALKAPRPAPVAS
jgi:hypothetical protein